MDDVGIDIVDNDYIRKNLTTSFVKHVLSEEEMVRYEKSDNKIQFVAGRFAVKEAIIKCLKKLKITDMTKITIKTGEYGEPLVIFEDYEIKASISHNSDYTVAVALCHLK